MKINNKDLSKIRSIAHEWYLDFKQKNIEMSFLSNIALAKEKNDDFTLFANLVLVNLNSINSEIKYEAKSAVKILKKCKIV